MEGLARRLLEAVAEGKSVRARDAVKLASAVVSSPEVQLAELILEGGDHQLTRAIELAGIVAQREPSAANAEGTAKAGRRAGR